MRPRSDYLLLVLAVAAVPWNWCSAQGDNQWQADGLGHQYLIPAPPLFTAAPSTVSVGTAPTTGYALDVHGEQMNPSLGNVFKTNADEHLDSYWRMFHGQDEFGQLFHSVGDKQFNINAPQGHLP
jgi:hypothetical protein